MILLQHGTRRVLAGEGPCEYTEDQAYHRQQLSLMRKNGNGIASPTKSDSRSRSSIDSGPPPAGEWIRPKQSIEGFEYFEL